MIATVAWMVLIFTALQFVVAMVNLLYRKRIPTGTVPPAEEVSVLVPARNEVRNIPALLHDLLESDYKPLEIIVCDDHSTDGTGELVRELARKHPSVRLIRSEPLPLGWLGKNFACWQLARAARGKYLLFLDAAVRLEPPCIGWALWFVRQHGLGLLSIFPRQVMKSWGEKMTVPLMNYILLTLLPLRCVREAKEYPSLAAANGQFMFFDAAVYRRTQPHDAMRGEKAEDIAIARNYKKQGIPVACLAADKGVSCRMYTGLAEAVCGFGRNVRNFFGDSFLLALLFWFITTFGFVFVYLAFPLSVFWGFVLLWLAVRVPVSLTSGQSVAENLLLCIPQQLCLGVILMWGVAGEYLIPQQWKGRVI